MVTRGSIAMCLMIMCLIRIDKVALLDIKVSFETT
ncbi:MAG: hypothetical protein ACI9WC_003287 [Arenicella sp.]|jgi:hypothetical protein